ncbi:MAG: hypothetical protein ISP76_05095, partial [Burkholderiales bacterium]|nr:hypothetical protein [Burkholderiales bacterium]
MRLDREAIEAFNRIMSAGTLNGYNGGMLWGLLGSLLFHVLVVATVPEFAAQLEDQRDFLTVQIDSAPEILEPIESLPEDVVEPIIPSRPIERLPMPQNVQPKRSIEPAPTQIVPELPDVPQPQLVEDNLQLEAPKNRSAVITRSPKDNLLV